MRQNSARDALGRRPSLRPRLRGWALAALALAILAGAFLLAPDAHRISAWLSDRREDVGAHLPVALALYFAAYLAFAALSLPGAWTISVAGGALFGPWVGLPLVLASSACGATLAMLASRYLLREAVAARFPIFVAKVDAGVAREGALWLLAARLTPAIPFFVVNLAVGLTRMPAWKFAATSFVGSAPVALLYVLAGARLASVQRPSDVVDLPTFAILLALGLVTLAARPLMRWREGRARLAAWRRPKRFDYNLIVVGAGSAGLVAAAVAAASRARVALIERGEMGGDCLNTGCVPSKALIRAARLAAETPETFGLRGRIEVDFPAVMARVRATVAQIAPHDSAARYRGLGVEVIAGEARVVDPWTVEVAGRRLSARALLIATGAEPALPPIPGLALAEPLTSETVWSLSERPARLLVVGGGAIGCELAQAFQRLGSAVTLVEAASRVLAREDEETSAAIAQALRDDGVAVIEGVALASFAPGRARLADGREIGFDRVLAAVGRRPRVAGFGLEALDLLENGRLIVDARLRTRLPTIHAAGDVLGELQFTHAAGQYGARAAINALLAPLRLFRADLKAFPAVTYTAPEVARVGLSEQEARERGIAYEVTRYDLSELDRALIEGEARGFVKALTAPGRDKILGVTIVGARAGEMLGEFTLAMRHGLGLKKVMAAIHPYPGWSEAGAAVALNWRREHASPRALRLARRLFAYSRGG